MRKETRTAFTAYINHQAQINGVDTVTRSFAVEPSIAQTLEEKIRESTAFLGLINTPAVKEQKGEVLGLGIGQPVASRTNTANAARQPRNPSNLTKRGYECVKTDYDTFVTYQQLDAWAKFPNFQNRIRTQVTAQIARDRLMIGWHGTHIAAETNLVTNPNLDDVNRGWLQQIRDEAPERVMNKPEDLTIGMGGAYRSLDQMVLDAANNLLADWYVDSPDLMVIVGRALLTDKYLALLGEAAAPTETAAMNSLLLTKTLGGMKAMVVPYFPANSLLITSPRNLSLYWQDGSHRRYVVEKPEKDRIEDYLSINEAFVVEDLDGACLLENITVMEG